MLSIGFALMGVIVVIAILWGSATWFLKKLNRPEAEQALINFIAVILLITSIIIWIAFRHQLIYLFQ